MKTLILYATKHGAAQAIAERIQKNMRDSVLHNLKTGSPALDQFDCVIIGSALYAGMIRKEAKIFMRRYIHTLRQKKLGLYLSGLDGGHELEFFSKNFPKELLDNARAAQFLGGIFDPEKCGMMERLITKAVAKQSSYVNTIDDAKIRQFAAVMQA
ncbi:MAG: flavodoxin domain-containing protein [Spirochaetota bacterium]|jgi:menaquinone-dependent protoporphyrinogen oxidase|nr:flavodoxin domain-containing protein [Spirochaetota bacterium]